MKPSPFSANVSRQQPPQRLNYAQQEENLSPLPQMLPLPTANAWNPNAMPWAVATKSSEQPVGIMQFSAQSSTQQKRPTSHLHYKRKSDNVAPQPPKQFISEEKITAHFNGLHISSSCIQSSSDDFVAGASAGPTAPVSASPSGKSFTNLTYHDYQVTAKELEEKLKKANRISMCEEIQKLHDEHKKVSFLPHALLNRIEKPCTALVLWQPPAILELLQNPCIGIEEQNTDNTIAEDTFGVPDEESIDDYVDNNNTCNLDFNDLKIDGMDTDL